MALDLTTDGAAYRFDTFRTSLLIDDLRYRRTDPGPGDPFPLVDLPLLGGGRITSDDPHDRPTLFVFGSRTCPVTESAVPRLGALHEQFGDRIRFVLVNTREAHPGDLIQQPATLEEKVRHAEALRDHHGIAYEVAVDDIDGTLHRAVGPKPNSAYLVAPQGTIVYRAHWANDDAGLRAAIESLLGGDEPHRGRSRAMVRPLMRAVGHLPGIVRDGGATIERDVWKAAPPLGLLGRVSSLFPSLPADRRGPAAALAVISAVVLIVAIGILSV